MRNITVSVDEETHRLARIRAAELDTSVSALVREFLTGLARGEAGAPGGRPRETERQRRTRLLDEVVAEITAQGGGLRMADNLPRESLYDRDPITLDVFRAGVEVSRRFGLSYWDGAILAAARALGCDAVYSEDMSAGQDYDGLTVLNPFGA